MFIHSPVAQHRHTSLLSLSLQPGVMSSPSVLSVCLSAASLILLQTAVSEAQYYDFTPAPDYDSDYNATFEYSFFSNASIDDLDKFSEPFIDQEEGEEEEGADVTVATTRRTTEQGGVNAASLPLSLEIRTLVWTLVILISLNTQQLRHTL